MSPIRGFLFDAELALKDMKNDWRRMFSVLLVVTLTITAALVLLAQVYAVDYHKITAKDGGDVSVVYSPDVPGGLLGLYEISKFSERIDGLESLTAYMNILLDVEYEGKRFSVSSTRVSPGFFDLFGVDPVEGRVINDEDSKEGSPAVAVISQRLMERRFQGVSKVVGQKLLVNDKAVEIVGVMPRRFNYPGDSDFWISKTDMDDASVGSEATYLGIASVGKERGRIEESIGEVWSSLKSEFPSLYSDKSVEVKSLVNWHGDRLSDKVRFMFTVAWSILLVGGACTINLVLTRFAARCEEWRVRYILGYGIMHTVGYQLFQVVLIFVVSALLSFFFFDVLIYYIKDYLVVSSDNAPSWWNASLSDRLKSLVAGYLSVLVVLITALLVLSTYKVVGHQSVTGAGGRWLYVLLQVSVTTFIVSFFILVAIHYHKSVTEDIGFDYENLLVASVDAKFTDGDPVRWSALQSRLSSVKGFEEVSISSSMPGTGTVQIRDYYPLKSGGGTSSFESINYLEVSPNFFDLMGIRLEEGRLVSSADYEGGDEKAVAVVDRKTSARIGEGEGMIGEVLSLRSRLLQHDSSDQEVKVVGVVSDITYGVDSFNDVIITGFPEDIYGGKLYVQVKTVDEPESYSEQMKKVIEESNTSLGVQEVKSGRQIMLERGAGSMKLMLNFIPSVLIATVMCALGIFDVSRSIVMRGRHDMGILKALGMSDYLIWGRFFGGGAGYMAVAILLGGAAFIMLSPFISEALIESDLGHYHWLALLAAAPVILFFSTGMVGYPIYKAVYGSSASELMSA